MFIYIAIFTDSAGSVILVMPRFTAEIGRGFIDERVWLLGYCQVVMYGLICFGKRNQFGCCN